MTQEAQLKACPLCRCEAIQWVSGGPGLHFLRCEGCGLSTDDGSKERISERWNTRIESGVVAELVEALRPFADKAQQFSKQPDGVVTVQIDFSNFRRAANALAKLEASK